MPSMPYQFLGDNQRHSDSPHPDSPQSLEPYIATDELKQAVNLAIYLGRPLLLEGEAGCGKTKLAKAVAYELGLPLYRWDVKSSSKAQEGLYTYDAILRLHDVELMKIQPPEVRNPADAATYVRLGELGKAFALEDRPAVVLIDEIDKADIDFPNDLLAVLEEPCQFQIRETGQTITAQHKPIVIITSNKEKGNLPAPFLRRCLYYFLQFPDQDRLKAIVASHYQNRADLNSPEPQLLDTAFEVFMDLRQSTLFKKPGTSEFLDWLMALTNFKSVAYKAETLKTAANLPYPELLFKIQADWKQQWKPAL